MDVEELKRDLTNAFSDHIRQCWPNIEHLDQHKRMDELANDIRSTLIGARNTGILSDVALATLYKEERLTITIEFNDLGHTRWLVVLDIPQIIGRQAFDPIEAYNRAMGILDSR